MFNEPLSKLISTNFFEFTFARGGDYIIVETDVIKCFCFLNFKIHYLPPVNPFPAPLVFTYSGL